MINKQKIIFFLVAIVAALLLINVILGLIEPTQKVKKQNLLTVQEIETEFLVILNEFALEETWITKRKLQKGKFDSIKTKYRISVPSGATIPEIIKDINKEFQNSPVEITSEEKKVYGSSTLTIKSNGFTKLISEFVYNPKLVRTYGEIGFLITEFENVDETKSKFLFDLAIPVGVILPLEEESAIIAEEIKSRNFNYFIQLNDDSDYQDFELTEDSGLEKLSRNVTNIISSFNSPRVFFVNELGSEFNASTINFISEKFQKRGRRLLTSNNFILLKGEDVNDLKSLIQFHLNRITSDNARVFRISIDDWFLIQEQLKFFVKKGNRIVLPNKLL